MRFILCIAFVLSIQAAELLWSDEFHGNTVDTKKWVFEQGNVGMGNKELQYYTNRDANARVEGGNLVITARKEKFETSDYTSARLNTLGHFAAMYGKFEMRAKLPQGLGIWPAFWLLGEDIATAGWPACGEIDIMEFVGKNPHNIYGSLHATDFDTSDIYIGEGFSDGYHTYAANWQPNQIQFSVDGHVYRTVLKKDSAGHWPFENRKFFIILNLSVGGYFPGDPDTTTIFPQEYLVDYVRVYKMDNIQEEHQVQSFLS